MLEHLVDVDGRALDRPVVPERFHAVDELADAVGLLADELREHLVLRIDVLLDELRRAANAGQRILDFVGKHGRHARDRTRRAAMGELAVHLLRHGAFLHHDQHRARLLGHGGDLDVDLTIARARSSHVDAVFAHRAADGLHLSDEREQRTAEGNQRRDLLPA